MSEWAGIEASSAPPRRSNTAQVLQRGSAGRRRDTRRQQRLALGTIDQAAHLVQRNGRAAILGTCVVTVPMVVVGFGLQYLLVDALDQLGSWADAPLGLGRPDGRGGVEVLVRLGLVCLLSISGALAGAYATAITLQVHAGAPVDMRRGYRLAVRRGPAVIGAWLLGHLGFLLVAWLASAVDLGRLAPFAIVLLPLNACLVTLTVLVTPVAVAESLGPRAALGRAIRLVRLRFGAGFAVVISMWLISVFLAGGLASLPYLAEATGLIPFFGYTDFVAGVLAQLALILLMPLHAFVAAQLYLQVRMDAEGLDIVQSAQDHFR